MTTQPRIRTSALDRALQVFLDGQMARIHARTSKARLKDPQILQARLDDPSESK